MLEDYMFLNDLKRERTLLQQTQIHHIRELYAPENPSGILVCQKHSSGYRWTRRDLKDGIPTSVKVSKKDTNLAEKLAVNLYRLICIQYLQDQISSLDSLIGQYQPKALNTPQDLILNYSAASKDLLEGVRVDNILAELPLKKLLYRITNYPRTPGAFFHSQSPYRAFILHHLQSEYADIIEWYLGDFVCNEDHPEQLVFPVKLGFMVRSKSEVMIADKLYEDGILIHYEEQLPLYDTYSYPDFTTMIRINGKYIWEHYGAMDKDYYSNRTRGKILNYLDNHWLPEINTITTYETKQNPLSEELVNQKVHWIKTLYRLAFTDLPPDEAFNMYDLATFVNLERSKQSL